MSYVSYQNETRLQEQKPNLLHRIFSFYGFTVKLESLYVENQDQAMIF